MLHRGADVDANTTPEPIIWPPPAPVLTAAPPEAAVAVPTPNSHVDDGKRKRSQHVAQRMGPSPVQGAHLHSKNFLALFLPFGRTGVSCIASGRCSWSQAVSPLVSRNATSSSLSMT